MKEPKFDWNIYPDKIEFKNNTDCQKIPKQLLLTGGSARSGKSLSKYICPECKVPLIRIDATLFQCPVCLKKVKAISKILDTPYQYYTDHKAEKKLKELFKHKVMNCSDRVGE